ncbi:MAG: hypothetical protein MJE66_20215 [Proteobacteria bacterium]|nr:hypothetical protein [Pseudomonadota bacterium]
MQLLATVATLVYLVTGIVVAVRLLLLRRRTRQLPELIIGVALLAFCAVGHPLSLVSRKILQTFGFEVMAVTNSLAATGTALTVVGVYVFTTMVFRPDSRRAWIATGLATAVAAGTGVGIVVTVLGTLASVDPAEAATAAYSPLSRLFIAASTANFITGFAWMGVEALRYHQLMRRRLALGMSDPVVVNRFLVWGVGNVGAAAISSLLMVTAIMGLSFVTHPVPLLLVALSGLVSTTTWILTFLAPQRYLNWVRRRSEVGG